MTNLNPLQLERNIANIRAGMNKEIMKFDELDLMLLIEKIITLHKGAIESLYGL